MVWYSMLRWGMLVLTGVVLVGCGSSDMADLQTFVADVKKNGPKAPVAPLPEIKPATPFVFNAEDLRDPFGVATREENTDATGDSGIRPDTNRPKEELESYALDGLRMVGTVEQGKILWGLVKAPDGTIHRLRPGNYAGKNYGKVVSVAADRIGLLEIVAEGTNAWHERDASIALAE